MKNIKFLLLTLLASVTANAGTHTQKTYLQTRPFLSNLPMEYSTWHTQVNKKKIAPWGGSFQATGFFQKSCNESNLGEYFGYYANNEEVTRDYIPVGIIADLDSIPARNLFHSQAAANNLSGKFKLSPSQRTLGLRLDYYQAIKKFFLKISTPITHVENGIHPKVIGNLTTATVGAGIGQNIMNYFEGNVEETIGAASLQEKLLYAKINGTQSKTGLGDIEVALGYNLYKNKGHYLKLGIDATIPTSNDAKGEWLFEPITGNGGYWGLGVFIDSKLMLWKENKSKIELLAALNLQYLFENTEKRTLALKNYGNQYTYFPLAQYYLAGEQGKNALFPAANILTQDVKIEPQFHFEGLLGLSLVSDNFTLDFGYNLFYKDEENISLKNEWVDNKYALAATDFDSNGAFNTTVIGGNTFGNAGPINSDNIDLEPAQSPSALTNKIYLALGYAFNNWKRPLMFGIGGGYEFHSGNTALEGFELWLKTALSF
ncbi:MAG: hypothetical protein JXR36_16090 [Bacteroidales bacterium]|nr:hypothetical protein [Bacteroidales bacterium]